jgi:hypothetical protein
MQHKYHAHHSGNMPADLHFVLKHFPFTSTERLAYSDTRLKRNNLFGPFNDVISQFDCTLYQTLLLGMQADLRNPYLRSYELSVLAVRCCEVCCLTTLLIATIIQHRRWMNGGMIVTGENRSTWPSATSSSTKLTWDRTHASAARSRRQTA